MEAWAGSSAASDRTSGSRAPPVWSTALGRDARRSASTVTAHRRWAPTIKLAWSDVRSVRADARFQPPTAKPLSAPRRSIPAHTPSQRFTAPPGLFCAVSDARGLRSCEDRVWIPHPEHEDGREDRCLVTRPASWATLTQQALDATLDVDDALNFAKDGDLLWDNAAGADYPWLSEQAKARGIKLPSWR